MMVLLRITIGWHFLYQGMAKYQDEDFTAANYLAQAKGPLADVFHGMIPDYDGRERLSIPEAEEGADADKKLARGQIVIDRWRETLDDVTAFYQFSAEDKESADAVLAKYRGELTRYLNANEQDIEGYFYDLDKLAADKVDPDFREVPYQRQRLWERAQELRSTGNIWLYEIDAMTESMLDELDRLATDEKREAAGGKYEPPMGRMGLMDKLITYSNLAIGVCLIAGLFTRLASIGGAVFLLMIVLSQPAWPTVYPPAPAVVGKSWIVTKEFIEMMAMFALAATHVGRWGGIDFFIHYGLVRPLLGKKETS